MTIGVECVCICLLTGWIFILEEHTGLVGKPNMHEAFRNNIRVICHNKFRPIILLVSVATVPSARMHYIKQ